MSFSISSVKSPPQKDHRRQEVGVGTCGKDVFCCIDSQLHSHIQLMCFCLFFS